MEKQKSGIRKVLESAGIGFGLGALLGVAAGFMFGGGPLFALFTALSWGGKGAALLGGIQAAMEIGDAFKGSKAEGEKPSGGEDSKNNTKNDHTNGPKNDLKNELENEQKNSVSEDEHIDINSTEEVDGVVLEAPKVADGLPPKGHVHDEEVKESSVVIPEGKYKYEHGGTEYSYEVDKSGNAYIRNADSTKVEGAISKAILNQPDLKDKILDQNPEVKEKIVKSEVKPKDKLPNGSTM